MKIITFVTLLLACAVQVSTFQPVSWSRNTPQTYRRAIDDDEVEALTPTRAFGAEAVPEDQRPVNEFLDVTNQPFFGWAKTGTKGLLTRLGVMYSVLFGVVCWPISGATFTQDGYILQKLAASNVGALLVVLVLIIRIYSGWSYIGSRLTSKVIEYEETGWYDGDFEMKTEAEQKRDRFLYNDQVKPVVNQLKTLTLTTGGLWVASCLALNVAVSNKPMFQQYDPEILERLRYDDKLAEKAASSSSYKPTYCDNRYYKALGSGQGC